MLRILPQCLYNGKAKNNLDRILVVFFLNTILNGMTLIDL